MRSHPREGDVAAQRLAILPLEEPARRLRMPNQGMANDFRAGLGSHCHQLVRVVKRELTFPRLHCIGLHRILGRHAVEMPPDDGLDARLLTTQSRCADGRANAELTLKESFSGAGSTMGFRSGKVEPSVSAKGRVRKSRFLFMGHQRRRQNHSHI